MSQAIFGAPKPRTPAVGGSSTPREKKIADTKASSRLAKSDVKTELAKNNLVKVLTGRVTP